MPQFYILWLLLFINVTARIALISNHSPLAQDACGITAVVAGTVIFIISLFNGLGRVFWSSLSDKLGPKAKHLLNWGETPGPTTVWSLNPPVGHVAVSMGVVDYCGIMS